MWISLFTFAAAAAVCLSVAAVMMQQPARQDFGFDVYKTNGAIYLTRRDVLTEQGSFYGSRAHGFIMPPERSIDIDTRLDFEMAEFLWRREHAQPSQPVVRSMSGQS